MRDLRSLALSKRKEHNLDKAGAETQERQPRVRNGAATRSRILEVAAELFATKGYRATDLGEVAKAIGVTRAAVYYYFDSKEELLWELSERAGLRLLEQLDAGDDISDPLQALTAAIKSHVKTLIEHKAIFLILLRSSGELPAERQEQILTWQREYTGKLLLVLQRGMEQRQFKPLRAKVAAHTILGALNGVLDWYEPSGELSPDEVGAIMATTLIEGLRERGVRQ